MGRKEFEWDEINGRLYEYKSQNGIKRRDWKKNNGRKYSRGGERMVMEGKMDVTERG